ncbi:cell envelope integrity protein CreD [Termitidicoccus mucosus]|uniref:Cell envelope integrity protein CreD n=1 Tax=Termitidicoccus mucosus TaxID=1184151 RepID=A0A178IIW6_9BACT|nr:hypothetical protein AW736_10990 [Opitutaceae bacterium TSB47]
MASRGFARLAGMNPSQDIIAAARNWLRRRVFVFKVCGAIFFALLLLIPLSMVRSTLDERQMRYHEAVDSITEPWGRSQEIIGPVLVVPYTHQVATDEWVFAGDRRVLQKSVQEVAAEAFFLPERLDITGELAPSLRKRGIHAAHVYSAALRVSGSFAPPDFAFTGLKSVKPQWERARVCFAITDLRGVRGALTLDWGGASVPMQPGAALGGAEAGVHALPGEAAAGAAFSLDLTLNGSGSFTAAPLGRGTTMRLASSWPDPSFMGAALPVKREVGPDGFEAEWEASLYGRSFPQQWSGAGEVSFRSLSEPSFGVRMQPAVDSYRTVERAIKHGVLFVALVFTVFFLFEATCGLHLNGLNYLLTGAALCLFFLSLLALAEFLAFGAAYAMAGAASTAMIGLYCRRILRSGRRALATAGLLGGVYAYLYFVLRMEDFSLLAGTAALFVMLGVVMYATRNLRSAPTSETASPAGGGDHAGRGENTIPPAGGPPPLR